MRVSPIALALATVTAVALGGSRAPWIPFASAQEAAPSDSVAPPPAPPARRAPAESLRVVRVVRRDTSEVVGPVEPRFRDPSWIDFDEVRKRGDVTLEASVEGRRAAVIDPLPLSGAPTGRLVEPGAGGAWTPGSDPPPGEGATDRDWIAAASYGLGFFDSHVSIVDPASEGYEVLNWLSFETALTPRPLRRADDLLTGPEPVSALDRAMPGHPRASRRPKSALYYSNGEMGELVTGARFSSPALGRGIGASYARHEADGVAPLVNTVSSHYAGAVGLPGALGHSFWVDGWLFERTIRDEAQQLDSFSDIQTVTGRSEAITKTIAMHGRAAGPRGASEWAIRGARAKRTRVQPDGQRERWEFPGWSLAWTGSWNRDSTWTAVASLDAAARRVEYADATGTEFSTRKDQGRLALGLRRFTGGLGLAADVAWDVRASDRPLGDGRLSLWEEAPKGAWRIDLESAHERPTWVDRLTPPRTILADRVPDLTKTLRLTRDGDPSLQARRLSGVIARGSVELSRIFSVSGDAAVRRVTDDFGWDLVRVDTVDSLLVDVSAGRRGDGWTSHASVGFTARAGTARLRGLGWIRRDEESLSPRAGSPPAWGAEGAFDIGVTLFRGDLPLILGVVSHVLGRRDGLIQDEAQVVVDAALRADFDAAGAFLELRNLFDRRYRSALYDLSEGEGVFQPGRALRFGLVWYLLD